MPAWLIFSLSAAAVVLAGVRLARDGDVIAERTGLGGVWVGAILVAAATSLPELTVDIFAVRQGHESLAVGDLFGSSMTNMLILAVADLATTHRALLTRVAVNQTLVGVIAIGLTATAVAGVLSAGHFTVMSVGWAPLAIGAGYLAGMRLLHQNRAEPPFMTTAAATAAASERSPGLRRAVIGFAFGAAVILAAAPFLARSAADLAVQWGVSTGFIGVLLLAVTTSLPEVAVTVSSLRAGSYDLAVGNLLGSNCFNMVILLPLDLVDGGGSILARVEPGVLIAGSFAILLMAQTLIEVLNKAERRVWNFEPAALLRVATYGLGIVLIYRVG